MAYSRRLSKLPFKIQGVGVVRLAFAAKLQSGKDTATDYLIVNYGGQKAKFANRLYKIHDATMAILGIQESRDRHFLQIVGTEWGRAKDPMIWAKAFEQDYSLATGNLFCSDARVPESEFTTLKKMGFKIVKIERSLLKRLDSEFNRQISTSSELLEKHPILGHVKILWGMWKQSRHKTERGVNKYKDYDYIVKNNGSLTDFYLEVDKIYKELEAKEARSLKDWCTRCKSHHPEDQKCLMPR